MNEIKSLQSRLNETLISRQEYYNKTISNEVIISQLNDELTDVQEECWNLNEDIVALEEDLEALDAYIGKIKKNQTDTYSQLQNAYS